jgi:hypothetical protein
MTIEKDGIMMWKTEDVIDFITLDAKEMIIILEHFKSAIKDVVHKLELQLNSLLKNSELNFVLNLMIQVRVLRMRFDGFTTEETEFAKSFYMEDVMEMKIDLNLGVNAKLNVGILKIFVNC